MVFLCFETHPQKTNICEFFPQISNIWKFTPTQQPPPTWVQCNHRPVALEASCTWCTPMILGKVLLVAAVVVVLVVVAMLLFFTLAIFFVWGVLFLVLFLLVFVAVFWSVSLLLAGGRNSCTTCRKHAQLSQCTQCAQRNIYIKIVKGQGCIICINTKQTITIYIYMYVSIYITRSVFPAIDKASQAASFSSWHRKTSSSHHQSIPLKKIQDIDVIAADVVSLPGGPMGGARKSYEHDVKLFLAVMEEHHSLCFSRYWQGIPSCKFQQLT